MESLREGVWNAELIDPSGSRRAKPRRIGLTMVIDKGLGRTAFRDMLETSGDYIDIIKLGFGTSALYSHELLREKIALCKQHRITIMPGGTFLEIAVLKELVPEYLDAVSRLGFDGIEVSDGTINMPREVRRKLIEHGAALGLKVFTEYGKKAWGSKLEIETLIQTIHDDLKHGSEFVTIEGRESGKGVGIYDEQGKCMSGMIEDVLAQLPDPHVILWEAPLKTQQAELINRLGPETNLGNIAPDDVLSLEALRRGLRADTINGLIHGKPENEGEIADVSYSRHPIRQ